MGKRMIVRKSELYNSKNARISREIWMRNL